jgi:hypothetical protein
MLSRNRRLLVPALQFVIGVLMGIRQQMLFESGLLKVEANGDFSLEEATRAFVEMLKAVAQYQAENVLLDGRNVKGNPREYERFLYGELAAQGTREFVREYRYVPRFAYVLHEPLGDPDRYGETVAVNRGMTVKVFETPEEALKWLGLTTPNTPREGA